MIYLLRYLLGGTIMSEKNIYYTKGKVEQKVDAKFLKNEMAQFLQIENLNFLMGAGCSSNIVDSKETAIPGMGALYDDFFNENPDFKIAGQDVKDCFDRNLEKMLEVMGSVKVTNQIYDIDKDIDESIKKVQKYIRNRIIGGLDGLEVLDFYKEFYLKSVRKGRKTPINIFTTNYDLYNEKALDELGFPYNNGFTGTYNRHFNPISYRYAFVENMNLTKDVWERVSTYYNLFKLHGSISWVKRDEQIWETNYNFINDTDTVMIYPTPLKDRTTLMTPYSDMFRGMENALMHKNSTLITMGYSFGDEHINRVILNSLAIPTFRLVVFGQSEAINKLKLLGDNRIIVINSNEKIQYFKNIVKDVMPDIQQELEEEMKLAPVSKIIKDFESEVPNE